MNVRECKRFDYHSILHGAILLVLRTSFANPYKYTTAATIKYETVLMKIVPNND